MIVMVDSLAEIYNSRLSQWGLVEVRWDMVSMDQLSRVLQFFVSIVEGDDA